MQKPRPVFISLVGVDPETDKLYALLESAWPKRMPDVTPTFIGDPFEDYDKVRIGNRRKREFPPESRTCFRWGLFFDFNLHVVRPAFDSFSDVIIARKYGYDLHAGAVVFKQSELALKVHKDIVSHGVIGLGIDPPLYVFTGRIDMQTQMVKEEYFKLPGQRCEIVDADLPLRQKGVKLFGIIERLRSEQNKPTEQVAVA